LSTNSNKTVDLFGFLNGKKCGMEKVKNAGWWDGNGKKCGTFIPRSKPGMTWFEKEGRSRLSIKTGHACSMPL
jgi:hypothetical protein